MFTGCTRKLLIFLIDYCFTIFHVSHSSECYVEMKIIFSLLERNAFKR